MFPESFITISWGQVATSLTCLSGIKRRPTCLVEESFQLHDNFLVGQEIGFFGHGEDCDEQTGDLIAPPAIIKPKDALVKAV
jgi:hypothetical protein